MKLTFYICKHCGNIITHIRNSGVPIMCCGQEMEALIPNTSDAVKEKHLPIIEISGRNVTVKIGSTPHPMMEEHYIEWICLQTKQGRQRKILSNADMPQSCFTICDDDEVEYAYSYCNLHGLWQTEYIPQQNQAETIGKANYIVCKCKNISLYDIEDALAHCRSFSDVEKTFEQVQLETSCSTGCGGCHDKIMTIISNTMMK